MSVGYGLSRAAVPFLLCLFVSSAFASELSVEGSVDETPPELKKLAGRAASLENRIRELEQRILEAQSKLLGNPDEKTMEFRLELRPQNASEEKRKTRSFALSHLRMSLNGRPFVYTQSAMVLSDSAPVPLFLGRIKEGQHLIKVQFQAAPINNDVLNPSTAAWQTVDRVFTLDLSVEDGSKQTQFIEVTENSERIGLELRKTQNTLPEKTAGKTLEKL